MNTGTIRRITGRGFGFITDENGEDFFFHMSACNGCDFANLREGQTVTFQLEQGPKGPQANNVQLA